MALIPGWDQRHPFFWSCMSGSTEAHSLEQLLEEARQWAGGPGSSIHLTRLGQWLKDHGQAARRGTPFSLTRLLHKMPDFCRIEEGTVTFLSGAPAVGEVTFPTEEDTKRLLQPSLFQAMVMERADEAAFLDFDNMEVVWVRLVDGQPGLPVSDDPMRYLRVPTISKTQQLEFALAYLSNRVEPNKLQQIAEAGSGWLRLTRLLLPVPEQAALRDARREWVIDLALEWMSRHDIPKAKFLRKVSSATSSEPPNRPANLSTSKSLPTNPPTSRTSYEAHLRARLRACIDQMTLPELLALQVPSRFLVKP